MDTCQIERENSVMMFVDMIGKHGTSSHMDRATVFTTVRL